MLEHFWWGSVFVINLPVMAALLVFGAWWLPESRDPDPGPFDLVSALLSAVGVVPLVYAIKEVALVGPNWTALLAGLVGVAGLWAFVRRQRRSAHPMIDVALFRNPAFSGAVGSSMIAIFALTGLVFFLSQYFQNVLGYSPLEAGLRELPLGLAGVLVVAAIGPVVRLLGTGRAIALGLLVSAGGLMIVGFSSGYGAIAVALVILGAGVGLALTLTTDAVVSAVPADKAGAASAVSETAYELGAALGIAVLGTVLSAWAATGTFTEAMQGTALLAAGLLAVGVLRGRTGSSRLSAGRKPELHHRQWERHHAAVLARRIGQGVRGAGAPDLVGGVGGAAALVAGDDHAARRDTANAASPISFQSFMCLGYWAMATTLDKAVEMTRTGDVWVFRERSAADRAIEAMTNSPVNDVGMAIVVDDLPPLMWHAELGKSLKDMWSGTHQRGAELHELRDAVVTWHEQVRAAGVLEPRPTR